MKIKIYAETFKIGSRYEAIIDVDKEEWEEMTGTEKSELVLEELVNGGFDWGWKEEE